MFITLILEEGDFVSEEMVREVTSEPERGQG